MLSYKKTTLGIAICKSIKTVFSSFLKNSNIANKVVIININNLKANIILNFNKAALYNNNNNEAFAFKKVAAAPSSIVIYANLIYFC